MINRTAKSSVSTAAAARKIGANLDRITLWRGWAQLRKNANYNEVPDSFFIEYSERGDVDNFEDIVRANWLKILTTRFRARNSGRPADERNPYQTWMLKIVTGQYPIEQINSAAENLFSMLEHEVLDTTLAELDAIQDPAVHINLDGISDPETRDVVTFSAALEELTGVERVMLAQRLHLDRLIYGRSFSEDQLANYAASQNRELLDESTIRGIALRTVAGSDAESSIPLSRVRDDLVELIRANPASHVEELAVLGRDYELVTYVGGNAVRMVMSQLD